jgi:hypothetical protein
MFKQPFYISVFAGILIWFIIFILTPATVTYSLSTETIWFVILSYLSLILGYVLTSNKKNKKIKLLSERFILYLILFVFLCFFIRFIDIFYCRGFRFSNSIYQNRALVDSSQNLLFILASVFKTIYFIPLLLLLLLKVKNKKLFILSYLLFVLPLFEAFLRGSRNPFFQSFLFFILILIYTKSIKFNKKNLFLFIISSIVLFFISSQILINREGPKNKQPYVYLVEKAIYNDFFKPKQCVIDYMNNNNISNSEKKISLTALQIGQYYTHGFFEFDYLIKYYQKNAFQKQYGKYTFNVFPKFTNIFHLSNVDLSKVNKASPRGYTFISFFGGMYIDFGWFALIIFFLLGAIQKMIYLKVKQNYFVFAPLFIFFLFTNLFMLTFNFFRGSGTYTLISCIIFALIFSVKFKASKIYEKGISA